MTARANRGHICTAGSRIIICEAFRDSLVGVCGDAHRVPAADAIETLAEELLPTLCRVGDSLPVANEEAQ